MNRRDLAALLAATCLLTSGPRDAFGAPNNNPKQPPPARGAAPRATPAPRAMKAPGPARDMLKPAPLPIVDGWTSLKPTPETRIIYVSSSRGSDANAGTSQNLPVKTIAAGVSKLRDGKPDWLLLRKGDEFPSGLGQWEKSGFGADAPMVIGTWGEDPARPRLLTGSGAGLNMTEPNGVRFLAIVGLEITPQTYTGTEKAQGVRWVGPGESLLIEDCKFTGYATNIVVQGGADVVRDVRIRRSVIADAYAIGSHSQGIFMTKVDGILIEECVLDHNGWKEGTPGAEATIFNHNIYLTKDTTPNTVVRGNLSANASSHGMQMRRGGLCENNLLIGNPINILFGQFQNGWPQQSATGSILRNVVLDSRDIGVQKRGFGVWMQMVDGVTARANLIAHQKAGGMAAGFALDSNFKDVRIEGNVVHDWSKRDGGGAALKVTLTPGSSLTFADNIIDQTNGARIVELAGGEARACTFKGNSYHAAGDRSNWFMIERDAMDLSKWASEAGDSAAKAQPPRFEDPERDLAAYSKSIGGEASAQAFLRKAREQSKANWDPKLTATAANEWIRAGYGLK